MGVHPIVLVRVHRASCGWNSEAVREADQLVGELVREPDYLSVSINDKRVSASDVVTVVPELGNADRLAQMVQDLGQGIARQEYRNASAGDIRHAMEFYRLLFDQLLTEKQTK